MSNQNKKQIFGIAAVAVAATLMLVIAPIVTYVVQATPEKDNESEKNENDDQSLSQSNNCNNSVCSNEANQIQGDNNKVDTKGSGPVNNDKDDEEEEEDKESDKCEANPAICAPAEAAEAAVEGAEKAKCEANPAICAAEAAVEGAEKAKCEANPAICAPAEAAEAAVEGAEKAKCEANPAICAPAEAAEAAVEGAEKAKCEANPAICAAAGEAEAAARGEGLCSYQRSRIATCFDHGIANKAVCSDWSSEFVCYREEYREGEGWVGFCRDMPEYIIGSYEYECDQPPQV